MNLKIFSKALYSSWAYHHSSRTLFDCGEFCATALGNEVYGPERICISHKDGDHCLGLPSFIGCRNSGRGDKKKPLTIYAPESDNFTKLKAFILDRNGQLHYPLNFIETNDKLIIPINDRTTIHAFAVQHTYNSYCYKIMESRKRLKDGIEPSRAKELRESGRDIYYKFDIPTFVWLLDSCSFDLSHIKDAVHVVFDSTFLKAADREGNMHASMEEVILWAKEYNVKRCTLAHISTRYTEEEVGKFAEDIIAKINYTGQVDVILGNNRVYDL